MNIEIAERVGNKVTFPPQRKHKQQQFGGTIAFDMGVLSKRPEMLAEVLAIKGTHDEAQAEDNKQFIGELETSCDELIEGAQQAAKVAQEMESEYVAELRRYNKAKDALDSANEEYRQVIANVNDDDLMTRSQRADRDKRIEKYREKVSKAAVAESLAMSGLNQFIRLKNQSANAAMEWEIAARKAQGELNALTGVDSSSEKSVSWQGI